MKNIQPEQIKENPFGLIGEEWMLITAGNLAHFNTMTASWGGWGVLWNKKVCFIFIRPQRYTLEFVAGSEYFSLCFFNRDFRSVLNYCGTHSGREVDKIRGTGLIPAETGLGNVYYRQAGLVMECRKIYSGEFTREGFGTNPIPAKIYPSGDYHHFFIGEVVNCLSSEDS